jgi:hypothetical protein
MVPTVRMYTSVIMATTTFVPPPATPDEDQALRNACANEDWTGVLHGIALTNSDTQPMSSVAIAAFLLLVARHSPTTGMVTVVSDFSWMNNVRKSTYEFADFSKDLGNQGYNLESDRLILAPVTVRPQPQ